MRDVMHNIKSVKVLMGILLVFGCLSLAGCDGEEEAPDAPPNDEQFDDTSGGGSA